MGELKDIIGTLEVKEFQWFNIKGVLEMPVLSSNFKARIS